MSRAKGVRFEHEIAKAFTEAGYHVRGLEAGGDHICVAVDGHTIHVECKRHERLRIPEWIEQAERDAGPLPWWIVFRQSRRQAYVIQPFTQVLP